MSAARAALGQLARSQRLGTETSEQYQRAVNEAAAAIDNAAAAVTGCDEQSVLRLMTLLGQAQSIGADAVAGRIQAKINRCSPPYVIRYHKTKTYALGAASVTVEESLNAVPFVSREEMAVKGYFVPWQGTYQRIARGRNVLELLNFTGAEGEPSINPITGGIKAADDTMKALAPGLCSGALQYKTETTERRVSTISFDLSKLGYTKGVYRRKDLSSLAGTMLAFFGKMDQKNTIESPFKQRMVCQGKVMADTAPQIIESSFDIHGEIGDMTENSAVLSGLAGGVEGEPTEKGWDGTIESVRIERGS